MASVVALSVGIGLLTSVTFDACSATARRGGAVRTDGWLPEPGHEGWRLEQVGDFDRTAAATPTRCRVYVLTEPGGRRYVVVTDAGVAAMGE